MSKWSDADETTIWKGLVVAEHIDGVDALDYLQHRSRADPEEVDA